MNDEQCNHAWGEAEECETGRGIVRTPVCNHCGALKFEEDLRARRRVEAARIEFRPAPRVHDHQVQIFSDV